MKANGRTRVPDEPGGRRVVVVGASAGGVETLARLVADLPADLPAPVVAVVHVSPASPSALASILDRAGPLPAVTAADGEPIENGRVYVAPPDRHLLLEDGRARVVRGPRENRHRPAIDPLFRSAALAYGPGAIGIILSGALDDGAAGLHALTLRGGAAIVQDPADALHPGMPESAIAADDPTHVVPAAEIPRLVDELARSPVPRAGDEQEIGDELAREARHAAFDPALLGAEGISDTVSPFGCPECGGTLWELEDDVLRFRFRCRVGHAYAGESLLAGQSEVVDAALWSALRALEERSSLTRRIAARMERASSRSAAASAARYLLQADEAERHAGVIRELLAGRNAEVT